MSDPPINQAEEREPPEYDPAAVGRIARAIEISQVELVHAHFERPDEGALPVDRDDARPTTPNILLDVDWAIDVDRRLLGYLVRFGAEQIEPPFRLFAFFRLTYDLLHGDDLDQGDLLQFGYWNAVFNGWPYFREYVSSTVNRAGMPRILLPVMRIPRREN